MPQPEDNEVTPDKARSLFQTLRGKIDLQEPMELYIHKTEKTERDQLVIVRGKVRKPADMPEFHMGNFAMRATGKQNDDGTFTNTVPLSFDLVDKA